MVWEACGNISGFEAIWNTWQGVVATGVLIIFTAAGALYALGGLLNHRGLRIWAQSQLYEGIVTLIMAIFFIGFVSWVCGLDARVIYPDTEPDPSGSYNMFDVAHHYLDIYADFVRNVAIIFFLINFVVAAAGSMNFITNPAGVGISISIGHALSVLIKQMSLGFVGLVMSYLLMRIQIEMLNISKYLFAYFMIGGLVMRAFGVTRRFGGALIGLALGLYVIFPLCIVLFYGAVIPYMQEVGDIATSNAYIIGGGFAMFLTGSFLSYLGLSGSHIGTLIAVTKIAGGVAMIFGALSAIVQLLSVIAYIFVGVILIPILTFIITTAFTKGVSRVLGHEIDLSNLLRLI